jgi:L-malate glycosyltransferase
MKIGITCYPTYGGSGAVATELGLDLARRGHEVHFITYDSPFRLHGYAERIYFHQVETRMGRYPLFDHFPYTLALASKQYEVVLSEGLEILHVHYAIPHATTAYLAREMLKGERPLKVITTLHGTDITLVGQESSFYGITKFSIEQSDEVTAVSAYLRDETYRAFGCVSCDVKVIPNFVNLQEYKPAAPGARSSLAPEGSKVITHVSNFREVKRVKDVVRVFARIRRAMPATLIMVGDGPERVDAENEARELGVTPDVRFLGRLDSVASLLQATDLFLLPSQTESFGLAALEAMACGSPVVASRAGGLPEVVDDGVNGILEPVGSVEAMGRRAVELLRDPQRYAAMREAAIGKAQEFSADRIVPMYEHLYEEVLRGAPAVSRADGR